MNLSQLVYIARALDGSWMAPTPFQTEEAAREAIAQHEPDLVKRNAYHILIEPLGRVLNGQVAGVKSGIQMRLVKWDGDGPPADDAHVNPEKYPQVAEVLEGGDGSERSKVIYRRS